MILQPRAGSSCDAARRGLLAALALAVAGQLGPRAPFAHAAPARQGSVVTILRPSGAPEDVVGEGDDYFTRVLGDPRDMADLDDLRWQAAIRDRRVRAGVWHGAFDAEGMIWPLFPGWNLGAANIGPIGAVHPVDANRYRLLTYRVRSASEATLRWWAYAGLIADGAVLAADAPLAAGTWQVHAHDLGRRGVLQGLALQLLQPSSDLEVDWVRLTDPDSSPVYELRWVGGSGGTVSLYADDDRSLANGIVARIAADVPDRDRYAWHTGGLPPGTYTVYLERGEDPPGGGTYSPGALTIVPAPLLAFTSPSAQSGDDYATTVLGRPWDMDGRAVVFGGGVSAWTWNHLDGFPRFGGGQMHAVTTGPDPYFFLDVDPEDRAIDARRFKHLSWRWLVEGGWTDSFERLNNENGWVTRFLSFSTWPYDSARRSNTLNDVVVWEGWNTYTLDLSQGYLDDGDPGADPSGWTGFKSGLRFDPLESPRPFAFHLDWIRLRADPEAVAGGAFAIRWTLQPTAWPTTITLSVDRDRDPANGIVGVIGTLSPPAPATPPPGRGAFRVHLPRLDTVRAISAPTSFTWRVPAGLVGPVYVHAEVDDGYNRARWTSDVPIVVLGAAR